ncbi:pentatricopeptide repeat-containing protein At3g22470, mitochondrial-like [Magnolia sinica]|uniref:pentatricopeptide repeat-containing protein At3g22470, mitochondrial-like n=1 Tax=Magnolia sinica TaxID=86752 RepID=UPI002659261F|nr:pentatricopeptide repeat-containing protein At3g22470, mitochondrial-like [Magnolia sinica]
MSSRRAAAATARRGKPLFSSSSIKITIFAPDSKIIKNKIPTPTKFNNLVNDLSNSIRAGAFVRLEDVVGLFDRMLRSQPLPSVQTFNHLLATVARMRHYSTVISFHREMNWLGIPSDIYTRNILLNCFCHLNGVGFGFAVLSNILKRGHEPDAATLATFRLGYLSTVFASRGIMEWRLGCSGNWRRVRVNVGLTLWFIPRSSTVYAKMGSQRRPLNLFLEMVGKGIRPNVFTYSSLIHGLCNLGQWKEAMILFEEMLDGGISPDVTTFSILVNALCKEGMIKEAHGLLELMTQRGEEPNVITYNALMNGYCFTNQMDAALKIFDNMVSKGHKPSVVTYNILIDGYCKNQMVDEAMQLFREMPCKGLEPNVVNYSTLICGLCRHGQCPNVLTYTILMDGLCKNERLIEAMKLLNEMEIRGNKPNNAVFDVLINGMCEAKELKYVKELFSWASSKGLGNNVRTYNTLINGLCKEGLMEEANGLFLQMEEKGCQPDSVTFNALIRGFLQNNETIKGMQLLGEMAKRHFSVDASTTSMLVGLLTEGAKGQEYLGMLNKFVP